MALWQALEYVLDRLSYNVMDYMTHRLSDFYYQKNTQKRAHFDVNGIIKNFASSVVNDVTTTFITRRVIKKFATVTTFTDLLIIRVLGLFFTHLQLL